MKQGVRTRLTNQIRVPPEGPTRYFLDSILRIALNRFAVTNPGLWEDLSEVLYWSLTKLSLFRAVSTFLSS